MDCLHGVPRQKPGSFSQNSIHRPGTPLDKIAGCHVPSPENIGWADTPVTAIPYKGGRKLLVGSRPVDNRHLSPYIHGQCGIHSRSCTRGRCSAPLAAAPASANTHRLPSCHALACPLGLKFPLGLPVVLRCVDAVLVVVDKVEPGQHTHEQGRVSRLPSGHALHGGGELALAVERLAGLDLIYHLAHVHLYLACVLAHAVEANCGFIGQFKF